MGSGGGGGGGVGLSTDAPREFSLSAEEEDARCRRSSAVFSSPAKPAACYHFLCVVLQGGRSILLSFRVSQIFSFPAHEFPVVGLLVLLV